MYILYPREDFADQIRLFFGSFLERQETVGVPGGNLQSKSFPKQPSLDNFQISDLVCKVFP